MNGLVCLPADYVERLCDFRLEAINRERRKRKRKLIEARIEASKFSLLGFIFGQILDEGDAEAALDKENKLWRLEYMVHLDEEETLNDILVLCSLAKRGDKHIYLSVQYARCILEIE